MHSAENDAHLTGISTTPAHSAASDSDR